jgi:DNA methylase
MAVAVSDQTSPPLLDPPALGSSVFTPNMRLPVHRWFRYSAGFSAAWAEAIVASGAGDKSRVLDPFVGSGTTLIAAQMQGAESIGLETHPLVRRICQAKLSWDSDPEELERRAISVLRTASPRAWSDPPALLAKIFPPATLATLVGLQDSIEAARMGDGIDELLWLALLAVLRPCSPAGTAQWQYVLPNKSKARVAEPMAAFESQARMMAQDMRDMPLHAAPASLSSEDARTAANVADESIDLVITSPPYPNNFDYADATRVEMTFLGEIERWGDLQESVRTHLVRSCSQHMRGYDPAEALEAPELTAIRSELLDVYQRLAIERESRGGRKAYHTMVAAYFHDLSRTWIALRRVCRRGSTVHFMVGDSAPYGVHVPVERWLGDLAVDAGFSDWRFVKLRDRNIKWRNRKHRVPLQEGVLTVRG